MIGKIICNKYVLISRLGCGEFSEVWLSVDTSKNYSALKIIDKNNVGNKDALLLFDVINKSPCEYCLTYNNKITVKDNMYIIQPLMAGSVYDIMVRQYSNGFPFRSACIMIRDLLRGLAHIHSIGIIHADVKPENILLVGKTRKVSEIKAKTNNIFKCNKIKTCAGLSKKIKNIFLNRPDSESESSTEDNDESETGQSSGQISSSDDTSVSTAHTASDIHSNHKSFFGRCELESDDSSDDGKQPITEHTNDIIDAKYINEPKVLLSDFGNSISLDDELQSYGDIQTRHYRAPEIILRNGFNEKSDIWAVGCTFYEILTGKVLFDPHKSYGCSTDKQNLYDIQLIGQIPNEMKTGRKRTVFFRHDGTLKGFYNLNNTYINEIIKTTCTELSKKQLADTIEFILTTLEFVPTKRPSANECLKMKIFSEL